MFVCVSVRVAGMNGQNYKWEGRKATAAGKRRRNRIYILHYVPVYMEEYMFT